MFKTGDNSNPDYYHGIAITSSLGKLFIMILNSRLDMFLEDNQIIDNVPIGYTKNARTSDHIFIVKSLIDKSINVNGGKLYSCFVDFLKKFDSVIHLGLQVKLKELHINGKFYDIYVVFLLKVVYASVLLNIILTSLYQRLEYDKEMY